jgi:dipeptidyl aminopeptidase/acylaminoacyl peptidase
MVNWIVSQTDRFKAAISDRSVANRSSSFGTGDIHYYTNVWEWRGFPWEQREHYAQRSPITHVERIHTPMLLIHGEQDLRCPVEQSEQLFVSLKVLGREVVLLRYPEESHELSRSGRPDRRLDRLERMVDWFDRHL